MNKYGLSIVNHPKRSKTQIDTYLDDENLSLYNAGASFRLRKKTNDNILVTLKRRKINCSDHIEETYNRISEEGIITPFQENDIKEGKQINITPCLMLPYVVPHLGRMNQVFKVKNNRKPFTIQNKNLQKMELRLDEIYYQLSNKYDSGPFFEIEIESKGIPFEETQWFATYLENNLDLEHSNLSKYERGVLLLKEDASEKEI